MAMAAGQVPARSSDVVMALSPMYLSWSCVTLSLGCYVIVMTPCHNASLAGRWYIYIKFLFIQVIQLVLRALN